MDNQKRFGYNRSDILERRTYMKTILKMLGYIVAVLLMAAGLITIIMYIMGIGQGNDPIKDLIDNVTDGDTTILTTMAPVESTTPAPDGNTILENTQQNGTSSVTIGTPTPVPTATPDPTPLPSPTPVPTPSPEPQAIGTPLGGGTFSSNTGKWIDIDAIWNAEAIDTETVKVTVVVNLRSYRIQIGEKRNALEISVGDDSTAMDVQTLNIDTDKEVSTELGTYEFTVDAPLGKITLVPLKANWNYGGIYSGAHLDVITAEGNITINR